jgi:hypothetical protein
MISSMIKMTIDTLQLGVSFIYDLMAQHVIKSILATDKTQHTWQIS